VGIRISYLELTPDLELAQDVDGGKLPFGEEWNPDVEPIRVGHRLVIQSGCKAHTSTPGDRVIALSPGEEASRGVFGTGLNPTTQLALRLLEEWITPGDRVLDLGTGSGILALAAARLDAREVLALDVEPAAVVAAHNNVVANDLACVVQVREGSVEAAAGPPYDLVVANLLPLLFRQLAAPLARVVRPAGLLIASGLIAARAASVVGALRPEGFHLEEERSQAGWQALVLRRVEEPSSVTAETRRLPPVVCP
jgi:ribosomal protein L11 methyltransferase